MGRRPSDQYLHTLGAELDALAKSDPKVAAAAQAFDDAAERIISGRAEAAHAQPCIVVNCSWHNPTYPEPPKGEELLTLALRRYWYDPEFHARCKLVFQVLDTDEPEVMRQIIRALAVDDITRSRMTPRASG